MAFSVFINFDGNCREAATFYAKAFGREEPKFTAYSDGPEDPAHPVPAGAEDRIMYTSVNIGGVDVMFCDFPPGMQFTMGNNISPVVGSPDESEIRGWFQNLSEGGSVDMELQKTFWSNLYGMVTDRFGVTWQLNLDADMG